MTDAYHKNKYSRLYIKQIHGMVMLDMPTLNWYKFFLLAVAS